MDRIYIDVLLQIINKFDIISLRAMACTCKKLDIICVDVVRRLVVTPLIDIRKIIEFNKFLDDFYISRYANRPFWSHGIFNEDLLHFMGCIYPNMLRKIHPKDILYFGITTTLEHAMHREMRQGGREIKTDQPFSYFPLRNKSPRDVVGNWE